MSPKVRVKNKKKTSFLKFFLFVFLSLFVIAAIWGSAFFYIAYKDLPAISSLSTYRPLLPLKIYSYDNTLIGEYGEQIREITSVSDIPEKLKQAVIASEDASFNEHFGINPFAIVRAMIANMRAGRFVQGGSTITQQVAKTFFLSPKKNLKRKAQEAILALRIEKNFSKDEILWLYCNQIYLGHNSYGVAAAARNYFRKRLNEMTLAEIAYIAGLPKAPSKYSPFKNPKQAKIRQKYVLEKMVENKYITQEEADKADKEEVKVYPPLDSHSTYAPYLTEQARRDVIEMVSICINRFNGKADPKPVPRPEAFVTKYVKEENKPEKLGNPIPKRTTIIPPDAFCETLKPFYDDMVGGEDKFKPAPDKTFEETLLYRAGLNVYTTADVAAEFVGQDALLAGLWRITRRMGYMGPAGNLKQPDWNAFFNVYDKIYTNIKDLRRDKFYPAMIVAIEKTGKSATLRIGKIEATMLLEDNRWARKPDPEVFWESAKVKSLADILKPGDLVVVRPSDKAGIGFSEDLRNKAPLPADLKLIRFELVQWPYAEAALMMKNVESGYILAMIGGWNYEESQINRTIQSCRQPGSAFKPLVYAAAIDKGWSPSTIIVDAPVVTEDENMRWTPDNFGSTFLGDTPLVKAIALSRNIPAIKTLQYAGITDVTKMARMMGITTKINQDYSIALGSSCVTMDELTNAYMHFPLLGKEPRRVLIRFITDSEGRVLYDARNVYDVSLMSGLPVFYRLMYDMTRQPKQNVSPATAYVMAKLMEQVVQSGTAGSATVLKRRLAGKTGTTNDSFDTWFMGYTPKYVAGAWIGFDNYERHLGKNETGGHASLPIFIDFFKRYLTKMDNAGADFKAPEKGVSWFTIDFNTGKRAGPDCSHPVSLPFKAGTAPEDGGYSNGGGVSPEEFMKQELQ